MIKKNLLLSKTKKKINLNFINLIQKESLNNTLIVGDFIKIIYKINENNKIKIHTYEGLLISKQNKILNKTITIRRNIQNILIEQTFFLNSLNIININKKESFKVRRAKLYFFKKLSNLIKK